MTPSKRDTQQPNQEDLKMVSVKTLLNTALHYNNRHTSGLAQVLWNMGMLEAKKEKQRLYFSNNLFKVTSKIN